MEEPLYSIRMHASLLGDHLSGAERLCDQGDLETVAAALLRRALNHEKGGADQISLKVDCVSSESVVEGRLPDLETIEVDDFMQGRIAALALLEAAGISPDVAARTLETLVRGAAPGGRSMRGAMLIDAATGKRLEEDASRGVRARGMDLSRQAEQTLRTGLRELGLDNTHVREALVLAAKVLETPGIVAELCWSDDPSYTSGYVASHKKGYQRITHLKPLGEERGGRAFFVQPQTDLKALVDHLEHSVLLINEIGRLSGPRRWTG